MWGCWTPRHVPDVHSGLVADVLNPSVRRGQRYLQAHKRRQGVRQKLSCRSTALGSALVCCGQGCLQLRVRVSVSPRACSSSPPLEGRRSSACAVDHKVAPGCGSGLATCACGLYGRVREGRELAWQEVSGRHCAVLPPALLLTLLALRRVV